jgi:hypothetical protein
MKHILLSHLRFHAERYEKDAISEREFVQTVLDLAIERIVDLDKGRDDECVTGSYDRSELAGVLVEAELMNSTPPPANNEMPSFPPSIAPAVCQPISDISASSIEIKLDDADLEDTEDNDAPACPRISVTPTPFKGPMVPARLDTNRTAEPLTTLVKHCAKPESGVTYTPQALKPLSIELKDNKTGDRYRVL